MIFEAALYDTMTTDAAAVIALAGTRLYPGMTPLGSDLPAYAYSVFRYPGETAHDGSESQARVRVQFTCTADTDTEARALALAIKETWHGFSGVIGGEGGVLVDRASVGSLIDGYAYNTDKFTIRVDVVFQIDPATES